MQNVFSAGKIPYEDAPRILPASFWETIKFYWSVYIDVVIVLILFIPHVICSIGNLFLQPTKKSLRGQNALVTGGAHGIGKAIAIRLAEEGCNIVIADIDAKGNEEVLQEFEELCLKATAFEIDVSDYEAVKKMRENIEDTLGPIDILVNNAGLMPMLSLREGTEDEINRITAVNLNANFWTVRTFLDGMMKRKHGHIMQISSMSAFHPMGGACIYTATKFAVVGFMRALEQELRQEGYGDDIHFTIVHPYFVSTRKDLMKAVNLRFPAVTAERTAFDAVEGLMRNQRAVVVPRFDLHLTALIRSLPYKMQCIVRDYLLKEKESRRMFKTSRSDAEDPLVNDAIGKFF